MPRRQPVSESLEPRTLLAAVAPLVPSGPGEAKPVAHQFILATTDPTATRRGLGPGGTLRPIGKAGLFLATSRLTTEQLRRIAGVSRVEPEQRLSGTVLTADPKTDQQWHLANRGIDFTGTADADVDANDAWAISKGRGVVVAVIDEAIDFAHPDLAGAIWTNPRETPGNGVDDDGNGYVDDVHGYDFVDRDADPNGFADHGTFVAGEIAARIDNRTGGAGLAPLAQVLALRALVDRNGLLSDAIEAIDYVTGLKRAGVNVPLINASWGTEVSSAELDRAIVDAGAAGVLIVAAAGNDGRSIDRATYLPASSTRATVLSVAASTASDGLADFSSFGAANVDLAAPGDGVVGTLPDAAYGTMSGTSMAAPLVTATAALLFSAVPKATVAQVREAIVASVDRKVGLSGTSVTGGRLNAYSALSRLAGRFAIAVAPRTANLDSTTDTGQSKSDGVTSIRRPAFSGLASPRARVEVFRGSTVIATATADAGGRYLARTTADLPDGTHVVQTGVTLVDGRRLPRSGFSSFQIDASVATPLAPRLRGDLFEFIDADGVTSSEFPSIVARFPTDVVGAEIFVDGRRFRTDAFTPSGEPLVLSDIAMSPGTHQVQVRAIDRAGNRSALSAPLKVIVDVTPPELVRIRRDAASADALWIDFDELIAGDPWAGSIELRRAGSGVPLTIRAVELRGTSLRVRLASPLAKGDYTLDLAFGAVTDRAGNFSGGVGRMPFTLA